MRGRCRFPPETPARDGSGASSSPGVSRALRVARGAFRRAATRLATSSGVPPASSAPASIATAGSFVRTTMGPVACASSRIAIARGRSSAVQTNAAGRPGRSCSPAFASASRSASALSPAPTTRTFTGELPAQNHWTTVRSPSPDVVTSTAGPPAAKTALVKVIVLRPSEKPAPGAPRAQGAAFARGGHARAALVRQAARMHDVACRNGDVPRANRKLGRCRSREEEGLPAAPPHLARAEASSGALGHRRGLEPELVPLLAERLELHALVVLQAAEKRLQALVALHLRDAFLEDLDRLLPLAALVFAERVDRIEERLALVGAHRRVEDALHLLPLLAAEVLRSEHRARGAHLHEALAQVRLGVVELLLHVEQRSDLAVQLRGDQELPAREREGALEDGDRLFDVPSRELLLRRSHHCLELLHGAAREQHVGDHRRHDTRKDAAPGRCEVREVEEGEAGEPGKESENEVDHREPPVSPGSSVGATDLAADCRGMRRAACSRRRQSRLLGPPAGGPPRNRTGMPRRAVDFESTASASSARGPLFAAGGL